MTILSLLGFFKPSLLATPDKCSAQLFSAYVYFLSGLLTPSMKARSGAVSFPWMCIRDYQTWRISEAILGGLVKLAGIINEISDALGFHSTSIWATISLKGFYLQQRNFQGPRIEFILKRRLLS
ncbi:uncharacterized protein C8R40DRAFT_802500 [Lentinula edodes]|uniref:uncharacterized protein n=1 Tax=Lentinula edodes TaxID=5353 RepID=UPI001E8D8BDD|nr:uncharacterized protein C8R40DRAFT_802500 [Lentinula edodes]KAH7868873.1 hypothetical protein C8R40DRAFT_802500 [Lentinula edodes]